MEELHRLRKEKAELEKENLFLKKQIYSRIQQIYHEPGGIIGHRSMRVFLPRENIFLSKTTIHKYMNRDLQLQCICRKRKPGYQRGHAHKLFPNLVHQNFQADQENQIWCTDFTYLYLINGLIRYNCTIIDLYDRSVVASENGKYMTSDLAIRTLGKAICASKCDPRKLILHSDQGSQFTSAEFTNHYHCRRLAITQSMSRAGCPYDNAPMELYYNTLKAELTNQYSFQTDKYLNGTIQEFAYSGTIRSAHIPITCTRLHLRKNFRSKSNSDITKLLALYKNE